MSTNETQSDQVQLLLSGCYDHMTMKRLLLVICLLIFYLDIACTLLGTCKHLCIIGRFCLCVTFLLIPALPRSVFMVFYGSSLVFHGSRSIFMVFHGSRLIFHCSRSVFMVFHGSRLVFHGSKSVFMVFL